mmetsp:Transcript_23716/g.72468  ORF Transcript_23716/g.72468 Transcript_23716/m.72468 type:complete len:82 (+) Transcript_23716:489-734(+)
MCMRATALSIFQSGCFSLLCSSRETDSCSYRVRSGDVDDTAQSGVVRVGERYAEQQAASCAHGLWGHAGPMGVEVWEPVRS